MAARILIIGFGNPLRGDDGLGPAALTELERTVAGEDVEFIECHQLVPELADDLSQADVAILIDASAEGAPGALELRQIEADPVTQSFTHHVSPSGLLAMSRDLFGKAPRTFIATVTGADFDTINSLSPVVREVLPRLLREVENLVRRARDGAL
jgi:hydrogenase maturation protease